VIHAVGPVWRGGDEGEPELLASAYRRSLEVAVANGLSSISFPSISTGAFVYPIRLAAPIAVRTIIDFLEGQDHCLNEVRMVLYSREDETAYSVFLNALRKLRPMASIVEQPQAAAEHPVVIKPERIRRILYVENHAIFAAQVCQQFLSSHAVTVVPSLSAAHGALESGTYDLLLLDYDLDDGKGDELVRTLRASGSNLQIIAVSSHEAGNSALLEAGANTVCGKMEFDKIQKIIDDLSPR
jgi:CheY-like chemotaxis protein